MKKAWQNPEARRRASEATKKFFRDDPEARRRNSETTQKLWQNPEIRHRIHEAQTTPEARRRRSEAQKKAWQNPETIRRNREAQKNPEVRRRHRVAIKKAFQNPEIKQRHALATRNSPKLAAHLKKLRHLAKPNGSEQLLHSWMDEAGFEYLKEHKIGRYFADVFVPGKNLIIECDGYYHTTQQGIKHDSKRDEYLISRGCKVLHIPSEDIDSGKAKSEVRTALGLPKNSLLDLVCRAARVFIIGNGGSFANAAHIAGDLLACGIRAFVIDPANLSRLANDVGWPEAFARWLRVVGEPGDLLIALSGSGTSPNILRAVAEAERMGMDVWREFGAAQGLDMQAAEERQVWLGHRVRALLGPPPPPEDPCLRCGQRHPFERCADERPTAASTPLIARLRVEDVE